MTTDEILNIDCRKEENIRKLNNFLYKIKPVKKLCSFGIVPLEILESVLHGICIKYKYRIQTIAPYYENGVFKYWHSSILKDRDTAHWIGNAYGITLWELIGKTIIKIYADIMKERKQK